MALFDIIGGIIGIGSAAASYQAGKDAARAAKAEANYNIFAADAQIGNIVRALPIQLRAINDLRGQIGLAHDAANIARVTAGVTGQRVNYLESLSSHTESLAGHTQAGAGLTRQQAGLTQTGAGLIRQQASHVQAGSAYTQERSGLKGREASLTREAAGNLKARSALASMAADVGRLGIENTVYNAEVQEQLASDALFEGEFDAETVRFQLRQMRGAAEANAAARNVVVGRGSAADINTSITFMGDREISKIKRAAERQALSHEVQATNLRHSIHGQELAIAGHEQSAVELELSSRQTALGADYTALEGRELMHRARGEQLQARQLQHGAAEQELQAQRQLHQASGQDLQASGQRLQAQDQRIQAQYGTITQAQQLLDARKNEVQANQLQTQVAHEQYKVGTSLVEIQDLERRKKLFEAQGKYGARAATLQGVTGAVSALVDGLASKYLPNRN